MSIQSFFKPSAKFFDDSYHAIIYQDGTTVFFKQGPFIRLLHQGPAAVIIGLMGLHAGKYIARYIRDHSFNQFADSNSVVIRTAYRTYHYLFPVGSSRKYFVEIALADNFFTALQMEIFFHSLPNPLDQPEGVNMDGAVVRVASVFLLAYCIDKVRLVVYKTLRWVPCNRVLSFALSFAPTGIYHFRRPNGEPFEFRN